MNLTPREREKLLVSLAAMVARNRLERGVVYAPDKARLALQNFFKESTLVALRELALGVQADLRGRIGDPGHDVAHELLADILEDARRGRSRDHWDASGA